MLLLLLGPCTSITRRSSTEVRHSGSSTSVVVGPWLRRGGGGGSREVVGVAPGLRDDAVLAIVGGSWNR